MLCTSILPSVVTSHTPAEDRACRTSRSTLCCRWHSPGCGNHWARNQFPTSTKTAPCSCAQIDLGSGGSGETACQPTVLRTPSEKRAYRAGGRWWFRSPEWCGPSTPPSQPARPFSRSCPDLSPCLASCIASDARLRRSSPDVELDIFDGHIVLEIEPGAFRRAKMPERGQGHRRVLGSGKLHRHARQPQILRYIRCYCRTACQGSRCRQIACGSTRRRMTNRQPDPGSKGLDRLVPLRTAG